MCKLVDDDFAFYLENEKKKIREIQKIPRIIIRDFIKACNSSDESSILKNLDENITFEERKNWKTIFETEGLSKFREYLKSSEQQLCGKDFKIQSFWNFNLPNVTIGVKYYPISTDQGEKNISKYEQIKFELADNKIVNIIYEN